VGGAQSTSVVTVKVLVEQNTITEVRIFLELGVIGHGRAHSVLVTKKEPDQPPAELVRDLEYRHHVPRTSRTLDLEVIPVVVVETLERLDEEVVDREPYRASPVGVSAEQIGRRLSGSIGNGVGLLVALERERVILVVLRQRPYPKA
jgi:hypothetical protein